MSVLIDKASAGISPYLLLISFVVQEERNRVKQMQVTDIYLAYFYIYTNNISITLLGLDNM